MAVSPNEEQEDQTRWSLIYASVIGFTVVVISLLYLFSQYYSG